jgi:hypothetical protein
MDIEKLKDARHTAGYTTVSKLTEKDWTELREISKELIDAAIARQTASEEVQEAIGFMENELEIIESFTSKYEFFSKNISIFKTILAALQAYQPWVSVSERLPESEKSVLLLCEVRPMGRKYVCIGYYAAPKSVESNCDDIEMLEYDEDTDAYYLQEGYYEEIRNWDEYSSIAISDFVIGWKHLPPKGE